MHLRLVLSIIAAAMLSGCSDSAAFSPLGGLLERALSAFASSLAFMVVALFAALPWVALMLFLFWLGIRLLRSRIRRRREQKARADKASGPQP